MFCVQESIRECFNFNETIYARKDNIFDQIIDHS